jgi:hypothetical protein
MALGVLATIVTGLWELFDIVRGEDKRSWHFLLSAWLLVVAFGVAFWRWHAQMLASIGNWAVFGAVVWVLFTLYLIGATAASLTVTRRRSRSRPAS